MEFSLLEALPAKYAEIDMQAGPVVKIHFHALRRGMK